MMFNAELLTRGLRRAIAAAAIGALVATAAAGYAEERTMLILHTNDLHDHVRPGYTGQGGLPYVASYVRSVREKRDDTLLLDGGDVREKGDWVAHLTEGQLIFEAMGKIGYDAVVPGNHDVKVDLTHLDKCEEWLGQPFVCANIIHPEDGTPRYLPSRIFEVNGVRVGVIGITRADKGEAIPPVDFSKRVLAEEAARIKDDVDVLVALMHEGGTDAMRLSRAAPDVQVLVTAHTHQTMHEPRIIEDTGAIMVQAGAEGYYVGRLELVVNIETGELVRHSGELIAMDHDVIEADPEILAMVREAEAKYCPEASDVIARSERLVGMNEVAQLVAESLRDAHGTDLGLSMADKVIRNTLPKGDIDINAVFRALAPWGLETRVVELEGAVLLAYLTEYIGTWDRPHWSGATITFERGPDRKQRVAETDIDPEKTYRIALTNSEWERLLKPFLDAPDEVLQDVEPKETDLVLRAFVKGLDMDEAPLCEWASQFLKAATS